MRWCVGACVRSPVASGRFDIWTAQRRRPDPRRQDTIHGADKETRGDDGDRTCHDGINASHLEAPLEEDPAANKPETDQKHVLTAVTKLRVVLDLFRLVIIRGPDHDRARCLAGHPLSCRATCSRGKHRSRHIHFHLATDGCRRSRLRQPQTHCHHGATHLTARFQRTRVARQPARTGNVCFCAGTFPRRG